MQIFHGLLPGQVLQRDSLGRGNAKITGTCRSDGDIECRVLSGNSILAGYGWHVAGRAADQVFEASLSNIPVGGPYTVELQLMNPAAAPERVTIDDIYVGDAWILAGQSNMEGVGNLQDAPTPHPHVRAFYMRDEWGLAREKLHLLEEAVDAVHNGYGNGPERPVDEKLQTIRQNAVKGVGPGMAFGLEMQERTGIPQGLVPCAHGGTSMAQWSPTLRNKGGKSLYGAMMRRFEKLGQPIAGLVWYQGESDANAECAAVYTEKMIELVSATRKDMSLPDLPWMIVQLGCHIADGGKYWNSIQEQQRRLPEAIEHLDVVPAVDLGLDDGIHIGGRDQQVLGSRLARIADRLVHGNIDATPSIRLGKIEVVPTPNTHRNSPCQSVKLTYQNVVGKLMSPGRPTGFALINENGTEVPGIFKTSLEGHAVLLHTGMSQFQLARLGVSYGHGRYPYCNITDAANMSIPAMQGGLIDPDHPPACNKWETTRLPSAKTINEVDLPMIKSASAWDNAPARAGFGILPKPAGDPNPGVFALQTCFNASENLQARLILGANAPFKIWLNGKLLTEDLQASPPLNPDQYKIDLQVREGENCLIVAFAPPGPGAHLGINACIGTPTGKRDPKIELF